VTTHRKKVIHKRNHHHEAFNKLKLKRSLLSAGVEKKLSNQVVKEVSADIDEIHNTKDVHDYALKKLLKASKIYAANYDLKSAIYKLGPTGYPFEILVAELFKVKGYRTKVSVIKKGKFVRHEVDVVAQRADGDIYCECKFHNHKHFKNDVKIPLYVHSRYLDVKEANPQENFRYALISNTQFSEDAIAYSKGEDLLLISLNYPVKEGVFDLIRKYGVYPITSLRSLRVKDQKFLLERKIVVINHLKRKHLDLLDLSEAQKRRIIEEIKFLKKYSRQLN